jgi:hypothetical protein
MLGFIEGLIIRKYDKPLIRKNSLHNHKRLPLTIDGKEYTNISRVTIETTEQIIELEKEYTNLAIIITGDINSSLSLTHGQVLVNGNSEDIRVFNGDVKIKGSCSRIETYSGAVTIGGTCRGQINSIHGNILSPVNVC